MKRQAEKELAMNAGIQATGFGVVTLAVALLAASLGAQVKPGSPYKNTEFGFSVATPQEWTNVPIQQGEEWIVAKYVSERRLQQKKGLWTHAPEMRIIVFPKAKTEGERVEKEKATGAEGAVTIRITNPYKGFRDFLEKNLSGFFIDDEKEAAVKGIPVTTYRTKSAGLGEEVPHRVSAYVYHLEDADVAVYFDILEDHFEKYFPSFRQIFQSFKVIERKTEATSTGGAIESREQYIQAQIAALTEGWWPMKTKRYTILSHADKNFTTKIATFAEDFRDLIENEFPPPEGKSPDTPIIRICKDIAEASSYVRGGGGGTVTFRLTEGGKEWREPAEVVLSADRGWGVRENAFRDLAYSLYRLYSSDLFEGLSMPAWLSYGLPWYFANVKGKGRMAKASPPPEDIQYLKKILREESEIEVRRLIEAQETRDMPANAEWKIWALVTYLREGAPKGSDAAKIIPDYIGNLLIAQQELAEKKKKHEEETKRQAEAKKDPMVKIDYSQLNEEMRKLAFERTFGAWSDADWKRLQASVMKYWD
ncbi:MAG: hypothetical protein AB1486_12615 [Planctomycetota bacterium]